MAHVDGYISRLDSLCRAISTGEQRIKALEEDHAKRLAGIDKKYRVKVQDLTNQKNAAVSRAKNDQQRRNKEIADYVRQVSDFDAKIPAHLRNGVTVDKDSLIARDCDWNDMQEMVARILDDTLWGKVKGVLNVYGHYSRKDMVRDYLTHLEEARKLAEQETVAACDQVRMVEQNATQRMTLGSQSADSLRKQETQQENSLFAQQKQREQEEIAKAADPGKFKLIAADIRRDYSELLRDPSVLANVVLPKKERGGILFGDLQYELPDGQAHKASIESGLKPYCRFPLVKMPYTVEAKGSYSILIEVSDRHRQKAFDGVRSVMARSIVSFPFEGLEVSYVDPIDRGTNLERFEKLSSSSDCMALRPPLASESDIEKEMSRLEKVVDELSLKLATVGTLDDFNAGDNVRLPHRLVVVNDFPTGFSRKALESLGVLLNNRDKCGFSFVFTHRKGDKPEREAGETYERVKKTFVRIEEGSRGFEIRHRDHGYRFAFLSSKSIPDSFFARIVNQYEKGKIVDNGFSRVCDFKKRIDFVDSTEGLFIPFAVNRYNEIINLELGTSSSAHMVITGSTGSGKSTTLHAIIAGIMLKYHPDDVEIWLVDYKETEFAEYLLNKFPNIKLVGLDKSKEFTFSLVDLIYNEKERREALFADEHVHVQDIKAYKKRFGVRSLPRIVVIIDEFHNLAQTIKDDPVYVTRFENILAECRSAGMSCIFSDQSINEGLRGLTEKGKKQLTCRVAMRNSSDEVQGTLDLPSSLNTEEVKAKISALGNGDVVMKNEKRSADGYDVTIEVDKYKSIYVKSEDRQRLASYIVANAKDCKPGDPLVVDGQKRSKFSKMAIQEFEATAEPPRVGETYLYLGTPSSFDPCFRILLTKQLGQNVAVLGQETDRRTSVILYAIRSFTRSKEGSAVILAHPEDPLYEQYRGLFAKAATPRIKICDDMPSVCNAVSALADQIGSGEKRKTLVVMLGYELLCDEFEMLPSKLAGKNGKPKTESLAISGIDEMLAKFGLDDLTDDEPERAISSAGDDGYDARDDIGDIVSKGCRFGIHVVLSLEKVKSLRKVKTFKLDSFDHRIALPISPDESLDFFGTSQAAKGIDQISAAYSDSGSPPQVFRPYLIPRPKAK